MVAAFCFQKPCGSYCKRAVCAWHPLLLVCSKGECAAGAALPVMGSPTDAFLASLTLAIMQEFFLPHRSTVLLQDVKIQALML